MNQRSLCILTNTIATISNTYDVFFLLLALKADKASLRISSEKPCITVLDTTTPEVIQRNTDDGINNMSIIN